MRVPKKFLFNSFARSLEGPHFNDVARMVDDRSRKKTVISPPCDIISDLPVNIIETILVCLPLRDAGRTSILSRKWRYKWVGIPQLVFDYTFCQRWKRKNQLYRQDKLMMTIYRVLLLHRGPILKFTFSVSALESYSDIDLLINFLSRNGVEEITLKIRCFSSGDGFEHYKLPSSFFSCLQLRRLNLYWCVFKPPPGFNGFSRLISLYFYEVDFDADLIGDLISNCPLLEQLTLISCRGFYSIEIDAPMLKSLYIHSSFNSIHFKNTPLLDSVIFPSDVTRDLEHLVEGRTSIMIELFGSLPVIKDLCLHRRFIKLLTLRGVPAKLPFTLNHLKCLTLHHMRCGARDEVWLALCLIKSSPNLEKIVIYVTFETQSTNDDEGPVLELIEVQDYSDFSLNQLRQVRMSLDSGSRSELEFIKLILANSPMLEKMSITLNSEDTDRDLRMLKELIRYGRASPRAQIICKHRAEHQSSLACGLLSIV